MTERKALVVEDEPNIRYLIQCSLEDFGGWQVLSAASGEEALTMASREHPDVILLDIMLPGMDGPTIYSRLMADSECAAIPVIFMTAKAQMHEVERYLALGASGVITKPFDPLRLSERILELIEPKNHPAV
ncbi:MAG TPA: response regulator [Candidatus Obscuribacterales bacterium]